MGRRVEFLSPLLYLERLLEKEKLSHLRLAPLKCILGRKGLRGKTSLLLGCKGSSVEKRLVLNHFHEGYTLNEMSNPTFLSIYNQFALGLQESEDPLFSEIRASYLFHVKEEKEEEDSDVLESILCINRVYFPLNNPPTPEDYTESLRRIPHSHKLIRNLVIERLRREMDYPILYWFMDTFPKTNLRYNLKGKKHTFSKTTMI